MKTLIQKVQERHNFKHLEEINVGGKISINKWCLITEDDVCDEMKLILSEMHDGRNTINNELRLSITNIEDENLFDEIIFFNFSDEQKLFSFLEFFVK